MTKPLDPELKALRAINRALNTLDLDQQRRALEWVLAFRLNYPGYRLPRLSEKTAGRQRAKARAA